MNIENTICDHRNPSAQCPIETPASLFRIVSNQKSNPRTLTSYVAAAPPNRIDDDAIDKHAKNNDVNKKKLVRQYFPEVWLFDDYALE